MTKYITVSDTKSYGDADAYGEAAIKGVLSAVANGELGDAEGKVTNYELADFLINNSSTYHTDKKQLKNVFAYFGLNPSMLDYVEDVGKGKNLKGKDFMYGVEYNFSN
jgi:hypothetical protein